MYKGIRKASDLSIDEAHYRLHISRSTLCKYESGEWTPPPDVILGMAKVYSKPDLPPQYCKNDCPIGQIYDHDITKKTLTTAVMQLLNAINGIEQECKRLIEIAADEQVTEDEVEDLTAILHRLIKVEHKIGNLKVSVSDAVPVEVIMGKEKGTPAAKLNVPSRAS